MKVNLTSVKETPLPDPPGLKFAKQKADELAIESAAVNRTEIAKKQVMQMAMSPGAGLLQTAFMLWMSGSSLQIFSIMMTGMALINPIKGIMGVNQMYAKFEKEEGVDLTMPKLIFCGIQLVALAMALYKCSTMGLLLLTSADWTNLIPIKSFRESSAVPL